MIPTADIQTLNPSAVIELFELDVTAFGGAMFRFHAGTNKVGTAIVWQGNTYQPYPIQAEGFEVSSKGVMPRPTIRIANLDGSIAAQIRAFGDLVGAKVTRRRTLAKFLDAINFPGSVNPSADPSACFQEDIYFVEMKTSENPKVIEWELSASSDLQGMLLPRRTVQATVCPWNDASICAYSIGNQCPGKTLAACKAKWGAKSPLPFGGFPGAGMVA